MPRNTELRQARDQYIRERFRHYRKRNPKWSIDSVISEVAGEVFLSEVTVVKILKRNDEAVPSPGAIIRHMNKAAIVSESL